MRSGSDRDVTSSRPLSCPDRSLPVAAHLPEVALGGDHRALALCPPLEASLLTWSQLDLQCSPDEGHQRGREVDGHVLVGDGHVHTNQALGIRKEVRARPPRVPPAQDYRTTVLEAPGSCLASQRWSLQVPRTKRGGWRGILPAFTLSLDPCPHLSRGPPWLQKSGSPGKHCRMGPGQKPRSL